MDSSRLQYFRAVYETGSIREAAEALRLSPAALSKAIKLLEEETGLELITPAGRGIAITPAGRKLAERAKPVLDSLNGLVGQIRDEQKAASEVARIGSFEVFTTYFLQALIPHLPPPAQILLREVVPGEMENALVAGEIDFGITYLPIPTAGVDHTKAASVRMGIFAGRGSFTGVPFSEVPFAIPVQPLQGIPNKVQGLDGWPDGKVDRSVAFRVTLMESALELCRSGRAAAYLPTFIAHLHNRNARSEKQLVELPAPKGLSVSPQPVYVARRKGDPEGKTLKIIARALREVCAV
ncbi:LysR family transcriptional regulator [bacterium]|nr:LysR family transcriptional regulator [bacterium]